MASLFPFILIADPLKPHENFAIKYQFHSIFQVTEKLHQRANKKKPDKYNFLNLARRVEEFTLRFLDSLSYNEFDRKMFFNNPETKVLVETAIKFEQKKVICSTISYLSMTTY